MTSGVNTTKSLCMEIYTHKDLAVFMQKSNVPFGGGAWGSQKGLVCRAMRRSCRAINKILIIYLSVKLSLLDSSTSSQLLLGFQVP